MKFLSPYRLDVTLQACRKASTRLTAINITTRVLALIISGVTISEELPHFAEVLVIATGIPPDAQSEPSSEKIVEMKRPRLSQPYNGKSEYLDTPTFVRLKGKG